MNQIEHHSESKRPIGSMSGLVVAAIGFQLLLGSATWAASACSDTLDRSARRIPSSLVHAFREIVDRHASTEHGQVFDPGFRLDDCPRSILSLAPVALIQRDHRQDDLRLFNLPPPMMG